MKYKFKITKDKDEYVVYHEYDGVVEYASKSKASADEVRKKLQRKEDIQDELNEITTWLSNKGIYTKKYSTPVFKFR